jgi:VanZ like protein
MPQKVSLDGPLTPGESPGKTKLRTIFLGLSVLAIGIATLRPTGDSLQSGWSFSLASGDEAVAEVIQNLLLFIPFGVALGWRDVRWRTLVLSGLALSFTVEFLQQWIPGRDPSVGDLVTNSVSTLLGGALVWAARFWLLAPERHAPWFALAAAGVAVTAWLATGWLLRPMLPRADAPELRTPDLGEHMDLFSGQVLSVTGRLGVQEPLRIVTVAGTPAISRRLAPILDVDDGPGPAGTIVAADRTDLVLRNRSRSMFLRLARPDLRARGALAGVQPGDTITISVRHEAKRGYCINTSCGLGYTVGDGWKLIFFPHHFPPWGLTLLNAMWVGGGLLGVGLWGRRHLATGSALLLAIATLALGPGLVGLRPTPLGEWLGASGGFVIGYLAWRGRQTLSSLRAPHSY